MNGFSRVNTSHNRMGNFNFECEECGWGEGGDGEDGRDYFGKPAMAVIHDEHGDVFLAGEYTGYGAIELPSGHTFWADQFEEYFNCWIGHNDNDEKGPFRCRGILCENCMESYTQTSFSKFSFSDFVKVKDYLEKKKAPAPAHVAPPAPAVAAPKKVKIIKVLKPKPLTKEELVVKVAEMEAELTRLRPLQERMATLQKAYDEMQKRNNRSESTIASIQRALNENQYW